MLLKPVVYFFHLIVQYDGFTCVEVVRQLKEPERNLWSMIIVFSFFYMFGVPLD